VNDWKIRQEIYHRLNTEFDDDLKTKDVQISDDVVQSIIGNLMKQLDLFRM